MKKILLMFLLAATAASADDGAMDFWTHYESAFYLGGSVTNLNAAVIYGTLATNNLPAALPKLSTGNGSGLTNLNAANVSGGPVTTNGATNGSASGFSITGNATVTQNLLLTNSFGEIIFGGVGGSSGYANWTGGIINIYGSNGLTLGGGIGEGVTVLNNFTVIGQLSATNNIYATNALNNINPGTAPLNATNLTGNSPTNAITNALTTLGLLPVSGGGGVQTNYTNTWTGTNTFTNTVIATNSPSNQFSGTFSGNGGGLTNLNALAVSNQIGSTSYFFTFASVTNTSSTAAVVIFSNQWHFALGPGSNSIAVVSGLFSGVGRGATGQTNVCSTLPFTCFFTNSSTQGGSITYSALSGTGIPTVGFISANTVGYQVLVEPGNASAARWTFVGSGSESICP